MNDVYVAIHLVDYEIVWSTATLTEAGMVAELKRYAVAEWSADPEEFDEIATDEEAAERYEDILDQLGVLITDNPTVLNQ